MRNIQDRYSQIVEEIFFRQYKPGSTELSFEREEIVRAAKELDIKLPKNLGDVIYSFRYRKPLPVSIQNTATVGLEWVIRPAGRSRYKFVLTKFASITPSLHFAITKIPDATPGIIEKYALDDEQALLARLRYNRLIDIFTGLTCYSLQNHLRTTIQNLGQVETDELYVGIDRRGIHYIVPIQAKSRTDRIGVVQIEQDIAVCQAKFPSLICRPVAAQMLDKDIIALFELEEGETGIAIVAEKHYHLVSPDQIPPEELNKYQSRT